MKYATNATRKRNRLTNYRNKRILVTGFGDGVDNCRNRCDCQDFIVLFSYNPANHGDHR